MKALSIFKKGVSVGVTKTIYLAIEVVSLFVLVFHVISSIRKIMYYGVKLSIARHQYRQSHMGNQLK
ncbi:hypothetical protein [Vibrio barjaei]|uniref:hypothetical protein n=1 Tax=Vibrio barjaei TaxID=1676683 RepID=UPI0022843CB5|nr:hypothetical protein [Vibrio barjaei]MCY9871070.1 hypothetical protein [Vibrio barjaei]